MNTYEMFSELELFEIREKFHYVNKDINGSSRIYFDNAGGSFRLKKAEEVFSTVDAIPDCSERYHQMAFHLQEIEENGRRDARVIFNALDGSIYPSYTASQIMFEMVRVASENAVGTNMVTTVLEHPSAFDSMTQYAAKHKRELRVAKSNTRTGGVDAEEVIKLIDKDTAILCVMAASNISGYVYDIEKIVTEARKINSEMFIIVDAVQHAPHGLLDVTKVKVDGMNFAPYKFFGVRGFGLAYLSDRMAKLQHHVLAGKVASEWELGSPAPAHYAAVTEIVNYVCWLGEKIQPSSHDRRELFAAGMKRIESHERGLLNLLLNGNEDFEGLRDMKGVHVCVDNENLGERDLIIGIEFENLACEAAVREFEKRNVIVYERSSTSLYSKRMVESFGLKGLVRVSPLHCNNPQEIQEFLKITAELALLNK